MHSHITFETLALRLIVLEMVLKLLLSPFSKISTVLRWPESSS